MKIWLDSLTGKQAFLVHHLSEIFEELGHEVLITSRTYSIDRSNDNLDRLGRKHISIGSYGGDLKSWLLRGSERIIELTEIIDREKPDLLISFPSPDAFRTAFGLAIPAIQINDTPHSSAVARLTISLSEGLVHSSAIKSEQFAKYGVTSYFPYDGIDEVLWIKKFKPNKEINLDFDITNTKYVVIRCEESKASYFRKMYPNITPGGTSLEGLLKYINSEIPEYKIVGFPRYPTQEEILSKYDVIIPDNSVDSLSLFYYATGVLTGGGTMGREAALLGTPTIYTFPLELDVNKYIKKAGFPIYHHTNLETLNQRFLELIGEDKMDEETRIQKISKMETPFDGIKKAIYHTLEIEL